MRRMPHIRALWTCGKVLSGLALLCGSCGDDAAMMVTMPPVMPLPTPKLLSVSPASGPTTGGTQLVITGENLVDGEQIFVGGAIATNVQVISPTELHVTLPARPGFFGPAVVLLNHPESQTAGRSDLFSYYAGTIALQTRAPGGGVCQPIAARIADFDGDGRKDLLAGCNNTGLLSLARGAVGGGYELPKNFSSGTGSVDVTRLTVDDWNRRRQARCGVG